MRTDVAITLIVGDDQNHIRPLGGNERADTEQSRKAEEGTYIHERGQFSPQDGFTLRVW